MLFHTPICGHYPTFYLLSSAHITFSKSGMISCALLCIPHNAKDSNLPTLWLIYTGCLISRLNALFSKPESTHLSTFPALTFFLKPKPSYLMAGYLSTLHVLSVNLYRVPKVFIFLFIVYHRVLSMLQLLPKHSICKHMDDVATQVARMRSNLEKGQLQ